MHPACPSASAHAAIPSLHTATTISAAHPPTHPSGLPVSPTPRAVQVCVEAGMLALRRDATLISHEDFNEAITEVQAKKKATLNYYA